MKSEDNKLKIGFFCEYRILKPHFYKGYQSEIKNDANKFKLLTQSWLIFTKYLWNWETFSILFLPFFHRKNFFTAVSTFHFSLVKHEFWPKVLDVFLFFDSNWQHFLVRSQKNFRSFKGNKFFFCFLFEVSAFSFFFINFFYNWIIMWYCFVVVVAVVVSIVIAICYCCYC